jgi:hypothetical protein
METNKGQNRKHGSVAVTTSTSPGIVAYHPREELDSKLTVESFGKIVVVDQADDRLDLLSVT